MSLFSDEIIVKPKIVQSDGVTQGSTPAAVTAVPAGGTGAAAGAWDTSAHRDAAITNMNDLITKFNQLVLDLQSAGVLK